MSVGHAHSRPNCKNPKELKTLLTSGGAPELMARWQNIDLDHDMPYLAGYNVEGTVRYIDRDVLHALLDPKFAEHLGIGPIDTGLSPEQLIACLMEHEGVEKVILEADNDIDVYDSAHEYATCAEHEKVRELGGKPLQYERALKKAIAFCAAKDLHQVPQDLDCAPALDDADEKILKKLRMLQIPEAFKASKADVDYSLATGSDVCAACAHWQQQDIEAAAPPQPQIEGAASTAAVPAGNGAAAVGSTLAGCALVCGLVRSDRWCQRFEPKEQADEPEETEARAVGPEEGGGEPALDDAAAG